MTARRKRMLSLVLAGWLAGCGDQALQGPSFSEAIEKREARLIVLYVPSSGFAARVGEPESPTYGEVTGITAEIMKAFGAWVESTHDVNLTLDFVEEPRWAAFYQRVRDAEHGVFGLGNVTITEERRRELAFSPPYLSNVATLITHEDVPELPSLAATGEWFSGMTGLLYPGTLHEIRLEGLRETHFPDMETIVVETNDELVSKTAAGDGHFGYIDIYNYWRATEDGHPLRRHPVADDSSEEFGIIMPRDSDWAPLMEAFFAEREGILGTRWHEALLEEHLGTELARLLEGSRRSQ